RAALRQQIAGVDAHAEEGAALVDQLLRQLAAQVAERQAHGIHERALLHPPTERPGNARLNARVQAAARPLLLQHREDEQGVAIEVRADLEDGRAAVAAR